MITCTNLATSLSVNTASSYATDSISAGAQKLILAIIFSNKETAGSPNFPTLSGASLTWIPVQGYISGSLATARITIYRAITTSATSGAITIDFASQNQNRCNWSIVELGGVDLRNGGNDAVVQTQYGETSASTTFSITLGAFSDTKNATLGFLRNNNTLDITAGSGFTEIADVAITSSTTQVEFKASPDTSVDWSWASSIANTYGVALELKAIDVKKVSGFMSYLVSKIVNFKNRAIELYTTPLFSDANLKFYWRFEGNANDSTANANHGTATDVTYSTANGKFGQGGGFNGTSSKIVGAYTFTANQATTIMGWLYCTATTSAYRNFMDTLTVKPMIWFDVNQRIEFDASEKVSTLVYRNQWVHVAISKPSGNSSATYYVNGKSIGSGNAYAVPSAKPTWFVRGTSEYWLGNADEVALFDRALTATEIASIYSSQVKKIAKTLNT